MYKLIREKIFEKFEEDSDPIKDLFSTLFGNAVKNAAIVAI